ncbi:MAG TPA: hypothetical protein EYP14_20810, partial [Planctomycetaceae bacterium]|nr:hypothetical protein [Planctomycetaceae bacterium]
MYELSVWARSSNRNKLVIFVTQPGETQRKRLATWMNVPRRWRRYHVSFSVPRDGLLQLELIGPSTHGAPVGRMWLDDVALHETKLPPVTPVSEGVGFNDEPTVAAGPDGSVYVAWVSFRNGADSLQLARFRRDGQRAERLGEWSVVAGDGTYVLGPTLVSTSEGAVLLFASEVDRNWDLYAVTCRPEGPGRLLRITHSSAVDVKPSAAWHRGTLWVAWESNRNGRRQIFTTAFQDGKLAEPQPLSPAEYNSYDPSVAVTANGKVCVAWYSFCRNNVDVYLRCRTVDGAWSTMRRLTTAPAIDRHPVLFPRGDELWLVYEHAQTEAYYVGRTSRRHLIVAQVGDDRLATPVVEGPSPFAGRCEAASPLFDADGRLWLAFLRPRLPRAGWDTVVTCYTNGRWTKPVPVSQTKGMDRRPGLARVGDALVVAFQAD